MSGAEHSDALWVRGGKVVGVDGAERADVLILGGRVQQVAREVDAPPECPVLECRDQLVFPGLIDTQVHFREPGLEHKEDLASGALAAIAGGITAFCEMPNTKPATTDPARLVDKLRRAAGRCRADYAFFLGATRENAEQLGDWETLPGCAGVKVFMGSSTGDLLVEDDDTLERVLRHGVRRVAVHAEDEPRLRERKALAAAGVGVVRHPEIRDVETALRATRRLLDLAERTQRRVHLLHVTTAEEVALLRERRLAPLVTAEVTPNHLFLAAPDCYEQFGTLAQMNPPVRERRHQEALRQALVDGVFACIGSDHAPHTREEKAKAYPDTPSGIPGVQTTLPLLLTAVRDGWLRLGDIVRYLCTGPIAIYGIERKGLLRPGSEGDLVVVDPSRRGPLPLASLHSRAGFSPYAGLELAGWPVATVLRGRVVYRDGRPLGEPTGNALAFAPPGSRDE
jgi:dihydroorotase